MDEALKAAWRAAQAAPDDAQARAAYGQALLRSGRRLAAALELAYARHLAEPSPTIVPMGGPREVELDLPPTPRAKAERWQVLGDLRPTDLPRVTPALVDGRLAHVRLRRSQDLHATYSLVPWPECPECRGGLLVTPCPKCDGRGQVIEFTGRAEERWTCEACGGTGNVDIACCDGTNLVPRRGRPERCEHDQGAPIQAPATLMPEGWTLERCSACGLCVLRDPAGDLHPACAGCGTFACDGTCDEGGTRASGSDP